jgi:tetratricopeptide (TPR) repeat protein
MESSVLNGLLDGTRPSPFLVISGDPGIGKTRLLTELAHLAGSAGRSVLWGRATEFEQQVPFGIVTDALCEVGPNSLQSLSDEDVSLLPEILPMLPGARTAGARPVIGAERYRLHRAVRHLLETLAGDSGLVLVLDDVHWADQGSAELIDHLLRHPPRAPVLVAVAYRPRQLSGRLRQGLVRAIKDGAVESMDLGPLTAEEVDALLPEPLDGARRRGVHEAGRGNPFYVLALARADLTRLDANPPGDDALPAQVRAALAAEIDSLTAAQERVAWAAAVAGDVADPELVACIADQSVEDVLEALDTLVARDVVRQVPHGGRFSFRHPLVRRVVHDAAGPGWRIAAHARAAAALRKRGAPVAEQAHHVELSAHRGDQEAIAVLREAATGAMHGSPASAVRWLAAALRLLPDNADTTALRLELLGLRAQALGLTGRLRESRETVHELLGLLPVEDGQTRASLVSLCAWIERLLGRHAEAKALLLAELANQPDRASPSAAKLMVGLAIGHQLEAHRDEVDWPRRALEAARRAGSRPLLAGALAACVLADQAAGAVDPGTFTRLDEAAALVDAMPDGELAQLLHGAVWLAIGETCEERTGDALRHLRRALDIARSAGQAYVIGQIHTLFAFAHGHTGDLEEASRHIEDARDIAELSGSSQFVANASAYQCYISTVRGDLDGALRLGRQIVEAAGGRRDFYAAMVYGPLSFAYLQAGDPAACTELLTAALRRPESASVAPMSKMWWYEMLAESAATQGRLDAAEYWADRAEAGLRPWTPPRRRGTAHLARVHALMPADPAGALEHARAAAELFTSVGEPIRAGLAHLAAGQALAALDEPGRAGAAFARSRALFEACGAALYVSRVPRYESGAADALDTDGREHTGGGAHPAHPAHLADQAGQADPAHAPAPADCGFGNMNRRCR